MKFLTKACTATRVQTARKQNPSKAFQSFSSPSLPAASSRTAQSWRVLHDAEAGAASSLSVSVTRAAVVRKRMSQTPSKCPQQSDPHLTRFSCLFISVFLHACVQNSHVFVLLFSLSEKMLSFRLGVAVLFLLII